MKRFDVIIVGAGPAGAILAGRLDQSLKVLLIDKRDLTGQSSQMLGADGKCCGGMLDDAARNALTHLGISLPKTVLQEPSVFSVRAVDFDNKMERVYPRDYLNIDRSEFDKLLLEPLKDRPNVTIWPKASVIKIKEGADGVVCRVRFNEETKPQEEVIGELLVGADGASSAVRRALEKEKETRSKEASSKGQKTAKKKKVASKTRLYAAIQETHSVAEPLPYYMAIFDQRVTDFYSWVIPKGKTILVGAAIPAEPSEKYGSAKQRFEFLKKDLEIKGFDLSHPVKTQGAQILRPAAFGSVTAGNGRIFLIGEAAGLISPSSAEGISFALLSGEKLAEQMNHVSPARIRKNADKAAKKILFSYRLSLLPLKRLIALKTLKSPVMYRKYPRKLVFLTSLRTIKAPGESKRWK